MITSSPLPVPNSTPFQELALHGQPKAIGAYGKIVGAEARAARDGADNVVLARIVGYFLLEFHAQRHILGDRPFTKVIDDVTQSSRDHENIKHSDSVVFAVGQRYRDHLIRAFRMPVRPYSPYDTLEETGDDYLTAREKALARDGFRCVVTGAFDEASIERIPELQRKQERLNALVLFIKTSHIVNKSATRGAGPVARHTAGVISSLQQFGLEDLAMSLQALGGVHQIWNLLSLQCDIHNAFGCLNLSFRATEKPNCYELHAFEPHIKTLIHRLSGLPGTPTPGAPLLVDLSSNCEGLPPPNPQLLTFHATCAWVAHASGVADFLDKLEWAVEEKMVLAPDGSSTDLLTDLISPLAIVDGVM